MPKPKPRPHGGARTGAGRRPSGRVTINANVSRETAATLRARAAQLARIAGHKRPQLGAAIDAAVLGTSTETFPCGCRGECTCGSRAHL